MRVSNKAIYDTVNHNLARASDAMLKANKVVSTGKRINRLSDDPVGLVSVLSLRSSIEYVGQLERNITTGRSWLNMGETAMSQMEDILSQAKALAIQMSSDNQGAEERANSAEAVEGYFQQILSLANTEVDGRYIFAGTHTDTPPYVLGTDDGGNTAVTYQGNDTAFEIRIAESINVAVGRIGTDIFGSWGNDLTADGDPLTDNWGDPGAGTGNIFKTLLDLKESLRTNDEAGIRTAMDELDSQLNRLRALVADTGSKLKRVELKQTIIEDLRLTYTDRKSELEDADIAEAVMDLQAKQLAYQAALKSSAQVMRMSLVDFI